MSDKSEEGLLSDRGRLAGEDIIAKKLRIFETFYAI
jgi:hypothetical protein